MQGIVPVGYAVFAAALGIAAGTMARRTLPAIAITLGGFTGLRVLVSDAVRQHYMTAVTTYSGMLANDNVPAGSWQLSSGIVTRTWQVVPRQLSSTGGLPLGALSASCQHQISALLGQAGGRMWFPARRRTVSGAT